MEYLVLKLLVGSTWLPGINAMNVPLFKLLPPPKTFAKNQEKVWLLFQQCSKFSFGLFKLVYFSCPC